MFKDGLGDSTYLICALAKFNGKNRPGLVQPTLANCKPFIYVYNIFMQISNITAILI